MILDLLGLDCEQLAQRLNKYDILTKNDICITPDTIEIGVDVIILIIVLVALWKKIIIVFKYIRNLCCFNKHWRKDYINQLLLPQYEYYLNERNSGLYIETRFQNEPPHNSEEPEDVTYGIATDSLIDHFIKGVFNKRNNRKLHYVLAGSGMGKTTFSVNLVVSYIKQYKKSNLPYDIRLYNLADEQVFDKIRDVQNKEKTILVLDALDENVDAVCDYKAFSKILDNNIKEFKFVIITCRTQFFTDEASEPYRSYIADYARDKGFLQYYKHFISPLKQADIDLYIDKVYGKYHIIPWSKKYKMKQKALRIINSSRSLIVRPLLLSYIKDLVTSNKQYSSIIDVYQELINLWLQREVNSYSDDTERKLYKDKLYELSELVAINIYENWEQRNGYYILRKDFDQLILSDNRLNGVDYQYDRRSLLNRDMDGRIKFSHKSFLEYFLAQYYFKEESYEVSFQGFDFAKQCYYELCANQLQQAIKKNHIEYKLTDEFYAQKRMYNDTLIINKGCKISFRNLLFNEYRPQHLIIASNVDPTYIVNNIKYVNGIDTFKIEFARKIDINQILANIGNVQEVIIKRGDTIIDKQVLVDLHKRQPNMKVVYNGKIIKHSIHTRRIEYVPIFKGLGYRDISLMLREIEEESLLIIPSDITEKMRSDREYIKTTIMAVKNS